MQLIWHRVSKNPISYRSTFFAFEITADVTIFRFHDDSQLQSLSLPPEMFSKKYCIFASCSPRLIETPVAFSSVLHSELIKVFLNAKAIKFGEYR